MGRDASAEYSLVQMFSNITVACSSLAKAITDLPTSDTVKTEHISVQIMLTVRCSSLAKGLLEVDMLHICWSLWKIDLHSTS
jgi:hypothetical protein